VTDIQKVRRYYHQD